MAFVFSPLVPYKTCELDRFQFQARESEERGGKEMTEGHFEEKLPAWIGSSVFGTTKQLQS